MSLCFIVCILIALSAQCGILTTMSSGGNIFKFEVEDNVCSIGEYFGTPEDYADGGVCTGGYSSYYNVENRDQQSFYCSQF